MSTPGQLALDGMPERATPLLPALWEGLTPPYRTIVADPPWQQGPNPGKHRENYRGAGLPYGGLPLDDIRSIPVADLAHPDGCRLYLWTTNKFLRHVWSVAEAWGFAPQDRVVVWCKPPRCTTPVTTEFVLVAKRGRPTPAPWTGTTWYDWGHQAGHSVKPAPFLDLVESWSPGPYVELFARAPRLGWDHWGHGYETIERR